ncbi:unnamed protein product [Prunus armeniaca]
MILASVVDYGFTMDVFQVLTENTGTRKIKGIMVKCLKPNGIPLILNAKGLSGMKKSDLSGIPNIKFLNLSQCTNLVEVHDSVGFLGKLVKLDLRECVKLLRFATRLRLKSLKSLCVRNCQRLESFPEIEDEMECLTILNMEGSGIRELPSSIVNLTRLQELRGDHCENLTVTSLGSIYGLQHLTDLSFKGCRKLLTFGDKVKSEVSSSNTKLQQLLSNSNIPLELPSLRFSYLHGCNFSESDFLMPLDCWNALTELDLSGYNFVTLPGCISKFVNLLILRLHGCKRLREIPEVLPHHE